jgi:hypothetical protein
MEVYIELCVVSSCDDSQGVQWANVVDPLSIAQYILLLGNAYGEWFPVVIIFKYIFTMGSLSKHINWLSCMKVSDSLFQSIFMYYDYGPSFICFWYF